MGLIIAALMAAGGFLLFMRGLAAIASLSCLGDPGLNIVSAEVDQLLILACIGTAYLLSLVQRGALAVQGVGTRFYGRKPGQGGYVTTKWLMLLFPLLPIRSYQVATEIRESGTMEFESQEAVTTPIPGYFEWGQVFYTASVSYGTILWSAGCLWLMFHAACGQRG